MTDDEGRGDEAEDSMDSLVRAVVQGWNDPLEALSWPNVVEWNTTPPRTADEAIAGLERARAQH